MADRPRVLAWDPQSDWLKHGYELVSSIAELARVLVARARSPARLSFKGRAHDRVLFERFCRCAMRWNELERSVTMVEELAWITSPGKAPAGWHELVTGGLKFGADLVAITQRPSESDKTALSQATLIRCFQLDRPSDRKYMAAELDVDVARVAALKSPEGGPLAFIERDTRRDRTTANVITL